MVLERTNLTLTHLWTACNKVHDLMCALVYWYICFWKVVHVYTYTSKNVFFMYIRVVNWSQRQEQLRSIVWTRKRENGQPEWPENTRISYITKEYVGNTATSSQVKLNWIYRQFLTRPKCLLYFQCLEECESHGLPPSEQGRLDLELKIEDTKENMRKAEVCIILVPSQLYIDG